MMLQEFLEVGDVLTYLPDPPGNGSSPGVPLPCSCVFYIVEEGPKPPPISLLPAQNRGPFFFGLAPFLLGAPRLAVANLCLGLA